MPFHDELCQRSVYVHRLLRLACSERKDFWEPLQSHSYAGFHASKRCRSVQQVAWHTLHDSLILGRLLRRFYHLLRIQKRPIIPNRTKGLLCDTRWKSARCLSYDSTDPRWLPHCFCLLDLDWGRLQAFKRPRHNNHDHFRVLRYRFVHRLLNLAYDDRLVAEPGDLARHDNRSCFQTWSRYPKQRHDMGLDLPGLPVDRLSGRRRSIRVPVQEGIGRGRRSPRTTLRRRRCRHSACWSGLTLSNKSFTLIDKN